MIRSTTLSSKGSRRAERSSVRASAGSEPLQVQFRDAGEDVGDSAGAEQEGDRF